MNHLKEADRHWVRTQEHARQWSRGREALRQLCSAPHFHVRATIAKLWLIARSHSASLDRTHVGWQPRVYESVAIKLQETRLDRRFRAIRGCWEAYDRKRVILINAAVADVTTILWEVSKQWKISLASKYPHYYTAYVPMYDSISAGPYIRFTERVHKAKSILTRSIRSSPGQVPYDPVGAHRPWYTSSDCADAR